MNGFDPFGANANQQQQQQQLELIRALQSAVQEAPDNLASKRESGSSGHRRNSASASGTQAAAALTQQLRDRERERMRANILADIQRNPLDYIGGAGGGSGVGAASGIGAFGGPLGSSSAGGGSRANPMFDLCRQLPTAQELNNFEAPNPMFSMPFLRNMQQQQQQQQQQRHRNSDNGGYGLGNSSSLPRHPSDSNLFASLLGGGMSGGNGSGSTNRPPPSPGMPSPHFEPSLNNNSNSNSSSNLFSTNHGGPGGSPSQNNSLGARMPPPVSFSDTLDFPHFNSNSKHGSNHNNNSSNSPSSRNKLSFRMQNSSNNQNNNLNNNLLDSPLQFGGNHSNNNNNATSSLDNGDGRYLPFSLNSAPSPGRSSNIPGAGRHLRQQMDQRRLSGGNEFELHPCGRPANRGPTSNPGGLNWNGPSPLLPSGGQHMGRAVGAFDDSSRIPPIHGPNYPFGPPLHNSGLSDNNGSSSGGGCVGPSFDSKPFTAPSPHLSGGGGGGMSMKRPMSADISGVYESGTPGSIYGNNMNNNSSTSRYRGVSWKKDRKAWAASIMVNGRHEHIGYFDNEMEAAWEWDKRARQVRGPDAQVNFPDNHLGRDAGDVAAVAAALSAAAASASSSSSSSAPSLLNEHKLMELARQLAANGQGNSASVAGLLERIRQIKSNGNNNNNLHGHGHDGLFRNEHSNMSHAQERMLAAALAAAASRGNAGGGRSGSNFGGPMIKRRKSSSDEVIQSSGGAGGTSRHVKAKAARTSSFRGVIWDKNSRAWRAKLSVHGKLEHIGLFDVEEQAAKAWDLRAIAVRGARAKCNFPKWAESVHDKGEGETHKFSSQRIRGTSGSVATPTVTSTKLKKKKKKVVSAPLPKAAVTTSHTIGNGAAPTTLFNDMNGSSSASSSTSSSPPTAASTSGSTSTNNVVASSPIMSSSTTTTTTTTATRTVPQSGHTSSSSNQTTTPTGTLAKLTNADSDDESDENFAAAASLSMLRRGSSNLSMADDGGGVVGVGGGGGADSLVIATVSSGPDPTTVATKACLASPAVVPSDSHAVVHDKPPRLAIDKYGHEGSRAVHKVRGGGGTDPTVVSSPILTSSTAAVCSTAM
jgi:hypothetical protein